MKLLAIVNFLIPLVSNREKSSDSSSTDSCSDLIFSVISGGKYCCSGYKMCLLAWEQMRKFPVEINGLCCHAIGLCDNAIGLCDNAIRSRENCILIAWQRNWIVLSHVIGECHAIGLCFTQRFRLRYLLVFSVLSIRILIPTWQSSRGENFLHVIFFLEKSAIPSHFIFIKTWKITFRDFSPLPPCSFPLYHLGTWGITQ